MVTNLIQLVSSINFWFQLYIRAYILQQEKDFISIVNSMFTKRTVIDDPKLYHLLNRKPWYMSASSMILWSQAGRSDKEWFSLPEQYFSQRPQRISRLVARGFAFTCDQKTALQLQRYYNSSLCMWPNRILNLCWMLFLRFQLTTSAKSISNYLFSTQTKRILDSAIKLQI